MEDEIFKVEILKMVIAITDINGTSLVRTRDQAIETRNACNELIEYLDEIEASTH
jgi:hypothetical protein